MEHALGGTLLWCPEGPQAEGQTEAGWLHWSCVLQPLTGIAQSALVSPLASGEFSRGGVRVSGSPGKPKEG